MIKCYETKYSIHFNEHILSLVFLLRDFWKALVYLFPSFVLNQDYCPEYDPVDQTIQKDTATLCNSKLSRNYYNSSDIYFCEYTFFHSFFAKKYNNEF